MTVPLRSWSNNVLSPLLPRPALAGLGLLLVGAPAAVQSLVPTGDDRQLRAVGQLMGHIPQQNWIKKVLSTFTGAQVAP